jgi:hypothetical protein
VCRDGDQLAQHGHQRRVLVSQPTQSWAGCVDQANASVNEIWNLDDPGCRGSKLAATCSRYRSSASWPGCLGRVGDRGSSPSVRTADLRAYERPTGLHAARHSAISVIRAAGVDRDLRKRAADHSDDEVHDRYTLLGRRAHKAVGQAEDYTKWGAS